MTDESGAISVQFRYARVPASRLGGFLYSRGNPALQSGTTVLAAIFLFFVLLFSLRFLDAPRVSALFIIGGLAGGAIVGAGFILLNNRMTRKVYAAIWAAPFRAGMTGIVLDAVGLKITHAGMHQTVDWRCIVDVVSASGHTLLLPSPYEYFPVPHDCLPDGLTPEGLHEKIATWRAKAAA